MKVNFFATLRDIAGGKTVEFDVEHGVTAQELLDKIIEPGTFISNYYEADFGPHLHR